MKLTETIYKNLENIIIDIYDSTASQFFWGEVDAPVALKEKAKTNDKNNEK